MYEPTYTVPRHLLYALQAASERVAYRRRKLRDAASELDRAIDAAVQAGANVPELVAYGVSHAAALAAIEAAEAEAND